jgi:hypothetical protein
MGARFRSDFSLPNYIPKTVISLDFQQHVLFSLKQLKTLTAARSTSSFTRRDRSDYKHSCSIREYSQTPFISLVDSILKIVSATLGRLEKRLSLVCSCLATLTLAGLLPTSYSKRTQASTKYSD